MRQTRNMSNCSCRKYSFERVVYDQLFLLGGLASISRQRTVLPSCPDSDRTCVLQLGILSGHIQLCPWKWWPFQLDICLFQAYF